MRGRLLQNLVAAPQFEVLLLGDASDRRARWSQGPDAGRCPLGLAQPSTVHPDVSATDRIAAHCGRVFTHMGTSARCYLGSELRRTRYGLEARSAVRGSSSTNVKRRRDERMMRRWGAAGILRAVKGFPRLQGNTAMPRLATALRARDRQLGLVAAQHYRQVAFT